jgi:glycosyltransferase involved in cell wall biosynthesis
MPAPLCSLLINNFNYGRFIAEAVESAFAQDHARTEIIVVDDGSTDESLSVLDRYRGRIKIIAQANAGQAAAMNAAVHASRGEILCFLDADDWWAAGKVSAVARSFAAHPDAVLCYHRLQPIGLDRRPISRPIPRTLCAGDLSARMRRSAGWWPFPMTSAVSVRRAAWDAAGDIPEGFRISADAWLVGIYPFLGKVASIPHPLGYYRIHQNAWHRVHDDAAMLRKRMDHWRATVEGTNAFLRSRGMPAGLSLADHLPHGIERAGQAALLLHALGDAGEPNLLRRWRNAFREIASLRIGAAGSRIAEGAR